jgi:tRNA pseudouridine38-40 synthase
MLSRLLSFWLNNMGQRNVKLTIAYDGSAYHGWQRQLEEISTVQQVLEEAAGRAVGGPVSVRGASRTDTGVHAVGQVANFFTDTPIPSGRLHRVITKYLPADIRVTRVEDVSDDFDAIASAQSKLYRYTVFNHYEMPLSVKNNCYHYYYKCDETLMQKASFDLLGEHDFTSFTTNSQDNQRRSLVRTLYRCQVWRKYHYIYFDVEGGGFLYHMVRNIVGMLLDIGRGHRPADCIPGILAAMDRQGAGPMAPACGLCLQWIKY